jgi:hypothetical protein
MFYPYDIESLKTPRYQLHRAQRGFETQTHAQHFERYLKSGSGHAYTNRQIGLRSGNTSAARGVVPFLQEAPALSPEGMGIRCVRADSGFFEEALLAFVQMRKLPYIVVARMTTTLKRRCAGIKDWTMIDENPALPPARNLADSGVSGRRGVGYDGEGCGRETVGGVGWSCQAQAVGGNDVELDK